MQGCLLVATKVLVVDLYAVQKPNKHKAQLETKEIKQTNNTTTTKPKQTKHREVGSLLALGIHA